MTKIIIAILLWVGVLWLFLKPCTPQGEDKTYYEQYLIDHQEYLISADIVLSEDIE